MWSAARDLAHFEGSQAVLQCLYGEAGSNSQSRGRIVRGKKGVGIYEVLDDYRFVLEFPLR